jgi:3-phosphoshikimate 1-carboxyvinyltransferase
MLVSFGCSVNASNGVVQLEPPAQLKACSLEVPGDFSSSAFFLVAGSISRGQGLTLKGVGINPTRTGMLDILALMGADLRVTNHRTCGAEPVADIEVHPVRLKGIHVPEHLVPLAIDEFPVLFVAAACAEGETLVTGAEELRVKESDRIAVMAEGLKAMGVQCEVLPDGMRIQGRPEGFAFSGGQVDSHGDHRIAMSFAVASLRAAAAIRIADVANVATSFPGFLQTARAAGLDLAEHA